jgi:hypothetical protein
MSVGGKRAGAGRKPGSLTKKTREVAERAAAKGITPLEYLLSVMRDESQSLPIRLDAAKASAPYIHPRLNAIEHGGDGGGPINVEVSWLR